MTDLLTLEDIAQLHKCDVRRAREKVVHRPGFPPPVPTSTPRKRLWLRRDVMRFLSGKTAH